MMQESVTDIVNFLESGESMPKTNVSRFKHELKQFELVATVSPNNARNNAMIKFYSQMVEKANDAGEYSDEDVRDYFKEWVHLARMYDEFFES